MTPCDVCGKPAVRTMVRVWIDPKVITKTRGRPMLDHHCAQHLFDPTPVRWVRVFKFDHVVDMKEWEMFSSCLQVMES